MDSVLPAPPSRRRLAWNSQRADGQVLVIFALFSIVLIGGLALSIDAGYLLAERRQAQSAADAGAMAAAKAAYDNKSTAEISATGTGYATYNAGAGATVTFSRPPTSGAHIGDSQYMQVRVTKNVTKFFIGAVYSGAWQVSASATSGIEGTPVNAAMLALNSNAGGIQTSGNTNISVTGGSIVSNYDLNTAGNTNIHADQYVDANDGFHNTGNTTITGGAGTNANAPEIPDPFLNVLSPPNLPSGPGNPVASVAPGAAGCGSWSSGTVPSGTRSTGGGSCVNISGGTVATASGSYKFTSGAGISIGGITPSVTLGGGTYNFVGGPGIAIAGITNRVELQSGNYSFTGGAGINISGNAPNNILDGGTYYFSGAGSGITSGGNDNISIGAGTYIFDGGAGISLSGNMDLHFSGGNYVLWFLNGADLALTGNETISYAAGTLVQMYFYGSGNNWSDLSTNGNAGFSVPSGEYYFDHGRLLNNGNQLLRGQNVFFYFKNGGYMSANGNSSFSFTAPSTQLYPGYYPGVFLYSDRANTATFTWNGISSTASVGAIYLPASPLQMTGNSNGKVLTGQMIADRFIITGNSLTTVDFNEVISTRTLQVFLVE